MTTTTTNAENGPWWGKGMHWFTVYVVEKGVRNYLLIFGELVLVEKTTAGMVKSWRSKDGNGYVGLQGHDTLDKAIADGQAYVAFKGKAIRHA
jgi:hypothetical protein